MTTHYVSSFAAVVPCADGNDMTSSGRRRRWSRVPGADGATQKAAVSTSDRTDFRLIRFHGDRDSPNNGSSIFGLFTVYWLVRVYTIDSQTVCVIVEKCGLFRT